MTAKKPYSELTFTDDFMFCKVLRHNEGLCIRLVELLLGVEIEKIEYKDSQHALERDSDSKGVRLDVYLRDEQGTVFDLEMQNQSGVVLPLRSRYYQSMIDVDHLLAGESFGLLAQSYVVFICTFDPFGRELHKYEFRNLCVEDPSIELEDKTSKVFINAKGRREDTSPEMTAFLDYLCGKGAGSELTRDIEESIARAKKVTEWEVDYMAVGDYVFWEKLESEIKGREEGRKEGIQEMAQLTEHLIEQERYDDLKRAASDVKFREQMLSEMGN